MPAPLLIFSAKDMRLRSLLLCALISAVSGGRAIAASNVQVIRQPSLLVFGDVSQSVGVTYTFAQHAGASSSTSAQTLSERYTFRTVAALLDPGLLTLDIAAGGAYRSDIAGQGKSSLRSQYSIMATALVNSFTPFVVNTSRDTSFIANGYTPSYTVTSSTTSFSGRLLHSMFPVQFAYGHVNSQTSGLPTDYNATSDSIWVGGNHNYLDRSKSSYSLGYTSEASGGRDSKSYRISLENASSLDEKRNYQLNTLLSLNESRPVDFPNRQFLYSEALQARLGKALTGGLRYQFTDSSTADFTGATQTQTTTSLGGSLSHRLFLSVTSTLSGDYSKSSLHGGDSTSYGTGAGLTYTKMLPKSSNLALNFSYSRRITDQELLLSQSAVRDEPHRVGQQGEFIVPDRQGTLNSVVSVRSLNPDTTYVEGLDYRVNIPLRRIEILVGGAIDPEKELLISYLLDLNPNIKYQSDNYSSGFMLAYLGNRYTLTGNVAVQKETLLAGQVDAAPLQETANYSLRANANYGDTKLGADYLYSDNAAQKFSKVGAHLNYNTSLSLTDNVSFNVFNDYFMYPGSGAGEASYGENSLNASVSYGGRLLDFFRTSAALSVTDTRSRHGNGNTVVTKVGLAADYSKLSVNLDATNIYRFTENTTNRDTTVVITLARSF